MDVSGKSFGEEKPSAPYFKRERCALPGRRCEAWGAPSVKAVFHAVVFLCALRIVETIEGADQIAGNPANPLEFGRTQRVVERHVVAFRGRDFQRLDLVALIVAMDEIHERTMITGLFLESLKKITEMEKRLKAAPGDLALLKEAKVMGFADKTRFAASVRCVR